MKKALVFKNSVIDLTRILIGLSPLIILIYMAVQYQWMLPAFNSPVPLHKYIQYRAPFLLLSQTELLRFMLISLVPLVLFIFCPSKFKKQLLVAVSFWYLAWVLGWLQAGLILTGCFMLWRILVIKSIQPYFRLTMVILALAFLYIGIHLEHRYRFLSWAVFAQILYGAYSTWKDHENKKEIPIFTDTWLLWCGIPCGFASIWYCHKDFASSFLNKPYWSIARGGIARIYLGLAKIIFVLAIELNYYPIWNLTRSSLTSIDKMQGPMTILEKSLWTFLLLALFLLVYTGSLQVLQGVTRLFGYNVIDQANQPWLSRSFLDFWQRGSFHTRQYMIRYVFFPSYFRKRSIYLSVLAVWAFHSLEVVIARQGIDLYYSKPNGWMDVWSSTLIKFILLFATACYIEMKWLSKRNKNSFRYFQTACSWLLLVFVLVLGNEVMPDWYFSLKDTLQHLYRVFGVS